MAQKFVADHMMPPEYVDQVVDFILKNTNQPDPLHKAAPVKEEEISFITEPVRLAAANLDGIWKKVLEFNTNQADLKAIERLLSFLKKETTRVPEGLEAALEILSGWSSETLFPVLDLVRVSILNEKVASNFSGFIEKLSLTPITPAVNPKISQANVTMQLRILCNAHTSTHLKSLLTQHQLTVLKTIRTLSSQVPAKEAALPHQTLLNFCLVHRDSLAPETSKYLLAVLLERCSTVNMDHQDVLMLVSAVALVYKQLPAQQATALATSLASLQASPELKSLISKITQ